ncbi:MAG: MBL fold metallo-hydrolase [Deltaproteobacteria bacterium]|nr:MBL fold metallo-hydrolase [Deltaproteobacteria bacterium]
MYLRFLGPLGRVTGSGYLLFDEMSKFQCLVDFGLVQDEAGADAWNRGPLPFDPRQLSLVVLTHAHIDHSGLIPRLYREGYTGWVWSTAATAKLAKLSLLDSARLGTTPYCEADVQAIRWYGLQAGATDLNKIQTGPDITLTPYRTAHLPGAVAVRIEWPRGSILFSGDVGPSTATNPQHLLLAPRDALPASDHLVCEATYGDRVRPEEDKGLGRRLKALLDAVTPSLASGGTVLMPVFAVGRAQDLIFDLTWLAACNPQLFCNVDVVLHSTLATQVTAAYADALTGANSAHWLNPQLHQWMGQGGLHPDVVRYLVRMVLLGGGPLPASFLTPQAIAAAPMLLNWRCIYRTVSGRLASRNRDGRPRIVLATSGMMSNGPICSYLPGHLGDPRSAVVITGHQAQNSLGAKLLKIGEMSPQARSWSPNQLMVPTGAGLTAAPYNQVQARIAKVSGYSGHADQPSLAEWLAPNGRAVAPRIYLTHGENPARMALAQTLRMAASGVDVITPTSSAEWWCLDRTQGIATRAA